MYVPWKRVASWHCDACGMCCRFYRPRLTAYEYLKLRNTGMVEDRGGKFYIRKIGDRCPFQSGRLCSLQNELKPISCKTFPFVVRRKGEEDAIFVLEGEEFYVYADTFCPNLIIKKDKKPAVTELAEEAVRLSTGGKDFRRLTAAIPGIAKPQQPLHRLEMV